MLTFCNAFRKVFLMSSLQYAASKPSSRAHALFILVAAPLFVLFARGSGQVIGHFHVTKAVAGAVVTMAVSGGWEFALVFPWAIPAEVTILSLTAIMGFAGAVAW
jgi:hypothetical protein